MSDIEQERELLLPETVIANVYTTQSLETGQIITLRKQKEKKVWIWTSSSYIWSLATLFILFIIFSGLEYALIKLNIPAVNS